MSNREIVVCCLAVSMLCACGSPSESSEPGIANNDPGATESAKPSDGVGVAREELASGCPSTFGTGNGALYMTSSPPQRYTDPVQFVGFCFSQNDAVLVYLVDATTKQPYGLTKFIAGPDSATFPGEIAGNIRTCVPNAYGTTAYLAAWDAAGGIFAKTASFPFPSCLDGPGGI